MKWINDIVNYFTYLRVVRKARKNDEKWKNFGLMLDWIGRAWFVLNLREEDVGEPDLVRKARVVQRLRPINEYFEGGLELAEIVSVSVEQKTERSYLIVYYPLFKSLSLWKVFRFFILSGLAILVIWYFGLLKLLTNLIWPS